MLTAALRLRPDLIDGVDNASCDMTLLGLWGQIFFWRSLPALSLDVTQFHLTLGEYLAISDIRCLSMIQNGSLLRHDF